MESADFYHLNQGLRFGITNSKTPGFYVLPHVTWCVGRSIHYKIVLLNMFNPKLIISLNPTSSL